MPTTSDAVPLIGTHTRYLFNSFKKYPKLKKKNHLEANSTKKI